MGKQTWIYVYDTTTYHSAIKRNAFPWQRHGGVFNIYVAEREKSEKVT